MIQQLHGDCRETLKTIESSSVQTVITSPPYFNLRDYGVIGQIGNEPTLAEYITNLVTVFRELRRVMRDDATAWLNLGDSYGAGKQLLGVPWKVAFALQDAGWYLRSDVIWNKPNCMPESVTDRPTRAHEYVFLLTKRERYFYNADAVREAASEPPPRFNWEQRKARGEAMRRGDPSITGPQRTSGGVGGDGIGRNRRTVWTVPTSPYSGAHFATFPEALIEPMILAGTSPQACEHCGAPWAPVVERGSITDPGRPADAKRYANEDRNDNKRLLGRRYQAQLDANPPQITGYAPTCRCENNTGSGRCVVLDPFGGSGTTGRVALKHGRHAILCELNAEYIQLQDKRTDGVQTSLVSLL